MKGEMLQNDIGTNKNANFMEWHSVLRNKHVLRAVGERVEKHGIMLLLAAQIKKI
jgi:hypothetical protein